MNEYDLKRLFPNASASTIRANIVESGLPGAITKPTVCHAPIATPKRKDSNTPRYFVCIESRRRRLLDPDNLCGKYFVDAIRYAKLIPNDSAKDIQFTIFQTKIGEKEKPVTIIEIRKIYDYHSVRHAIWGPSKIKTLKR